MVVVIFGINTTSDISKLFVVSQTILKHLFTQDNLFDKEGIRNIKRLYICYCFGFSRYFYLEERQVNPFPRYLPAHVYICLSPDLVKYHRANI